MLKSTKGCVQHNVATLCGLENKSISLITINGYLPFFDNKHKNIQKFLRRDYKIIVEIKMGLK